MTGMPACLWVWGGGISCTDKLSTQEHGSTEILSNPSMETGGKKEREEVGWKGKKNTEWWKKEWSTGSLFSRDMFCSLVGFYGILTLPKDSKKWYLMLPCLTLSIIR